MGSPVLVTGGTGTLGRRVVRRLRDAGSEVRVLSRHAHAETDGVQFLVGDLVKGEGIESAVDGVAAIVHCASDNKGDVEATRNLVQEASRVGAPHLVYISIVGIERVSFGYTRSKLAAERVVSGSGLPWTTLRATQYYDLILAGYQKVAWLPVIPIPAGFRIQPVDADEVAARLVEVALGEPAGRVADIGGPQVSSAVELLRVYLRVTGRRRWVVPVWLPGIGGVRAGGLLVEAQPGAGDAAGGRTWEEFLAERLVDGNR